MAQSDIVKGSEIIEKDLFKDAKISADELNSSLELLVKSFKEINSEATKKAKATKNPKDAEQLKANNEALKEAEKSRKALIEAEKQLAKLKEQQAKKNKQLTDQEVKEDAIAKELSKDRIARLKAEALLMSKLIGTEQKLLASNTLLRLERKKLNLETSEGQKRLKEINHELDLNTEKIKNNSDKQKQQTLNVGNYKDSVKEAIAESEVFNEALNKLDASNNLMSQGFGRISSGLKKIRDDFKNAGTASEKAGIALKGGGWLAGALAIGALYKYFRSSSEGARDFDKSLAGAKGTLDIVSERAKSAGVQIFRLTQSFGNLFLLDFESVAKRWNEAGEAGNNLFRGGMVEDIKALTKAEIELVDITYEHTKALRSLQIAQSLVNQDIEDFAEIQQDSTRTLQEQKQALNSLNNAKLESAKLGEKIASKDLEIEKTKLAIQLFKNGATTLEIEQFKKLEVAEWLKLDASKKLNDDEKDLLKDKYLAFKDAQDKLDDLPRQNAMAKRKQIQDETALDIDLILKKKLNANAEIAILTKRVADEKTILEQRTKDNLKLTEKEYANFLDQTQRFNEGIVAENKVNIKGDAKLKQTVDFDSLRKLTDGKQLKDAIKALRISEEQQLLVAKIIKDYQDNEIAQMERKQKLHDAWEASRIREAQIEANILSIKKQSELDIIKDLESQITDVYKEQNNEVLANENVFNDKLLSEREAMYEKTKELLLKEYDLRSQIAKQNYENELEANNKIAEVDERNAKNRESKAKYDAEQSKIDREKTAVLKKSAKDEAETQRQIEVKKREIIVSELQQVTQAISAEMDKQSQIRETNRNREIDKTEKDLDYQRERALKGMDNQLAFEEQQLAKQEQARKDAEEEDRRRKERIVFFEAFMNAYNNRLKDPTTNPDNALMLALADTAKAKALSMVAGSFFEGTEQVSEGLKGNKVHNGRDGYVVAVDGTERVMTGKQNEKVGSLSNDELATLAYNYRNGLLNIPAPNELELTKNISTADSINASLILQSNAKIEGLLKELVAKPVQNVNIDNLGNVVDKVMQGAKTRTTVLKTRNRLW